MIKKLWKARNFRKLLLTIEEITKQENLRKVDFMAGFRVANIEEAKRNKHITKFQAKLLTDLVYIAADEMEEYFTKEKEEKETKQLIINSFIKGA